MYKDRVDTYSTLTKKIKKISFVFMVCAVLFIFCASASLLAFESAVKTVLTAEYIMPDDTDSNGDGVLDSWYQSYGFDYNDPDIGGLDPDDDGITNKEEYRLGTDPLTSNSGIIATLSPSASIAPQMSDVTFTAGYSGNVNPIVKYEWDFDGNGTYDYWCYASEGNTATYNYTADGDYNPKVRITDSVGNAGVDDSLTLNITKNGVLSPPTATTALNGVDITTVPSTVELDGTGSDNVGVIRYQWDTTGNGEYDVSSSSSGDITKTYKQTDSRSFDTVLRVTDTDGLASTSIVGVNIDATAWIGLYSRPKVYLNRYVVTGTVGVPISLSGYCAPEGGNSYGFAKKLEWDFESDGIYDYSTAVENASWTGTADVLHAYGAPGIYRAVLRGHTDSNVSATDSVLVIISGTDPVLRAQAKVSYNGTVDATSIDGIVPVQATFNHSFSTGSIVKYEWDFDGDKKIDYTTTSSSDEPIHYYQFSGYQQAMLQVTDSNGLIDTFYIPVFSVYPVSYSSYIKMPQENQVLAGNSISLVTEVFPDDAGVSEVMFQYKRDTDVIWTNIGVGTPVMSYTTTWDTTGLVDGATYDLRAIVNGIDSTSFKSISVVVDNSDPSPDVYESSNGSYIKKVKVDPSKSNFIVLPDGTHMDIPQGALPDDGSTPEVTIEEVVISGASNAIDITMTGIDTFLKDITLSISYPDADNDGIVDGTGRSENDIILQWYNETTGEWEPLYNSVVHPNENFVSAQVNHLTTFGAVFPVIAAITGAGSSASGGSTASYCFIATAAYGTPQADDVMVLRDFRDKYLLRNNIGRGFVWNYYRYSPSIAKFIKDKPVLKRIVRYILKPLVKFAKKRV